MTQLARFFAAFALVALAPAPTLANDIGNQMDQMFGTMSNVNRPMAYMGARRGVVSGGSFELRNRVVNDGRVANWDPPHLSASCNGISAYAGSFSFISKDEMVQTLRAIPSAAASYAFSLALAAVSPTIKQEISEWQSKLQDMTKFEINSCKMAQLLVDKSGAGTAMREYGNSVNAQLRTSLGLSSDQHEGEMHGSSTSGVAVTAQQNPQAAYENVIPGNVVWMALKKSKAAQWYANGDNRLLEDIMTITGTVVICSPGTNGCPESTAPGANTGQRGAPVVRAFEGHFTLEDLVNGNRGKLNGVENELHGYTCSGEFDLCLNVGERKVTFEGFRPRLEKAFLGTEEDGSGGILGKFAVNSRGASFSDDDKKIVEMTAPIGPILITLARNDVGMARHLAREYMPMISTYFVYQMMRQVLDSTSKAVSMSTMDVTGRAQEVLAGSWQRLEKDRERMVAQASQLNEALDVYEKVRDLQMRTSKRLSAPAAGSMMGAR